MIYTTDGVPLQGSFFFNSFQAEVGEHRCSLLALPAWGLKGEGSACVKVAAPDLAPPCLTPYDIGETLRGLPSGHEHPMHWVGSWSLDDREANVFGAKFE